jgi:starvation-inducible outer membrane lipoprotein
MAEEWGAKPWELEEEIENTPELDLWIERYRLLCEAKTERLNPKKEHGKKLGRRRKIK